MQAAAILGSVTNNTPVKIVSVYVDVNQDGQFEPDEPSTVADTAGNFFLSNIPPDTWTIRVAVPPGYTGSDVQLTVAARKVYVKNNLTITTD
jgi:hypothetical protein